MFVSNPFYTHRKTTEFTNPCHLMLVWCQVTSMQDIKTDTKKIKTRGQVKFYLSCNVRIITKCVTDSTRGFNYWISSLMVWQSNERFILKTFQVWNIGVIWLAMYWKLPSLKKKKNSLLKLLRFQAAPDKLKVLKNVMRLLSAGNSEVKSSFA